MTDIALDHTGEILLEQYGDFQLISDDQALIQHINNRLLTPSGSLFYEINFGSDIPYFIHMNLSSDEYLQLKESIYLSLKQEDLIDEKSVEVNLDQDNPEQLLITINFSIIDDKKIHTTEIMLDQNGTKIL